MNAAGQRRLTPLLVVLALLLGVLLLAMYAGLGRGVHWNAPRKPAPLPNRQAAKLPPPAPLQQFADVWQKPLFSPDRRPLAQSAGNGNLGEMQLTGIILTPELHMALLHDKGGAEIRVREGSSLPDGSWTLAELRPRSALFDSPNGRVELQLPNGAPIDQVGAGESAIRAGGEGPDKGNPASAGPTIMQLRPASAGSHGAVAGGEGRPHEDEPSLQAKRLQQLKAAVRKRRAEQAAKANEGDR